VFRKRVMQNFEGRCCLSGINEEELLVAGHIVPWAKRIDTRLDPSNGFLLYCPYDRLFDKGFISFDDRLRVVVGSWADRCSPSLRTILKQLAGQQARLPVKWSIKQEYLAYHRAEILQAKPPAPERVVAASPE
jgi:putative restriction endonuclease